MPLKLATLIAVSLAVLAIGAAGAIWLDARIGTADDARPGLRHGLMHVNCPPGSHGAPRYAKFGQSLGYGRADSQRDGDATTPLRDRSLTSTIPTRASNPSMSNR